ncbi:alpha/beta fold hydrolase [Tenacibaculum tangerinum]|uniref:Alpha/beta fold hydrolase n=1 Tax=Tenacibaculum tangerinum TaxID=3038772 RepID=A0ABY8KYB3_9FLAO|nr:alpha/beta fold hydrolase [Tenacibaculum tangerinum]WGH74228.1 alpha/beta fold hydrolase [Tenacibaculum tangerinum]
MKYKNISPWLSFRDQGIKNYESRWVFFPYAGATSAVMYPIANKMDSNVEVLIVDLPGRGKCIKEPLVDTIDTITENLVEELSQLPELPTYFFGYSLGTLIAYELALALKGKNIKQLVLAAGSAPHDIQKRKPLYNLEKEDFWNQVKEYGGLPKEILNEPELLDFIEPILRADFKVIDCYNYKPQKILNIPIIAIAGSNDFVCPPKYVENWKMYTTNEFNYFEFDGGHFFMNNNMNELHKLMKEKTSNYTAIN